MDETSDDLIPYTSIEFMFDKDHAALTAMCFDVRVHVQVQKSDLLLISSGSTTVPSTWSSRFESFVESIDDDPSTMQSFEDWLFLPCVPHLQQHLTDLDRRRRRHSTLSIHDYYHATTFEFDLKTVDDGRRFEAFRRPIDTKAFLRYLPRVSIADTPTIASAIGQEGVPCICASQLLLVRDQTLSDWEYFAPPGVVERIDQRGGSRLFFKPAQERDSLTRELDILLRIRKICPYAQITKLVGLVQWNDDPSIAGLLLEYIPNAKTLDWQLADDEKDCPVEDRSRWMSDLRQSMQRLHEAGIVWGDVKPQNVLIDMNDQAWIVDFGGGYSLPWVSKDLSGTKEGDLAGLEAIASYLGV